MCACVHVGMRGVCLYVKRVASNNSATGDRRSTPEQTQMGHGTVPSPLDRQHDAAAEASLRYRDGGEKKKREGVHTSH